MNDDDRAGWVLNDEYLYYVWKSHRISLSRFVRENRAYLTEYINQKLGR